MEKLRNLRAVPGGSAKVIYAIPANSNRKSPFSYTQRVIPVTCMDGITRIYSIDKFFLEKNPGFKDLEIIKPKVYYPCALCDGDAGLAYTSFKFYPDKIDFSSAPFTKLGEFIFVGVELSWDREGPRRRSYRPFNINEIDYMPYCEKLLNFIKTFPRPEKALWVESFGKLLGRSTSYAFPKSHGFTGSNNFNGL